MKGKERAVKGVGLTVTASKVKTASEKHLDNKILVVEIMTDVNNIIATTYGETEHPKKEDKHNYFKYSQEEIDGDRENLNGRVKMRMKELNEY